MIYHAIRIRTCRALTSLVPNDLVLKLLIDLVPSTFSYSLVIVKVTHYLSGLKQHKLVPCLAVTHF